MSFDIGDAILRFACFIQVVVTLYCIVAIWTGEASNSPYYLDFYIYYPLIFCFTAFTAMLELFNVRYFSCNFCIVKLYRSVLSQLSLQIAINWLEIAS